MAGELALSVIPHVDGSCLAWGNGFLGVGGHGAATAGYSLVDDKWGIARIGEGECAALHGLALGKRAEIMLHLVELDFCLLLGHGITQRAYHHDGHEKKLFHLIPILVSILSCKSTQLFPILMQNPAIIIKD